MARQNGEIIAGYHGLIHAALWKRILTAGVPRMWFILNIITGIFMAFLIFSVFRSWAAVVPLALALVTQVGLMALTRWDPDWDSVLLYSVRYKSRYAAG